MYLQPIIFNVLSSSKLCTTQYLQFYLFHVILLREENKDKDED